MYAKKVSEDFGIGKQDGGFSRKIVQKMAKSITKTWGKKYSMESLLIRDNN